MRHITKACILNLLLSFIAAAQTPLNTQPVAQRDPQAVAVLTATLNAADPSGASLSQDFTALGTITYYWAGNEVKGAVTLLGKGAEQFRLDAALPDGTRSFAVSYGIGKRKQPDGTTTTVAFQNTANAGPLNLPFAAMASALTDSSAAITYVALEALAKQQVHRIRIQRNFSPEFDPDGSLSGLRTTDYFIDAVTFLVAKTQDTLHADDNALEDYQREIHLSDHRSVSGLLVPFSIAEDFAGQRTWKIQLDSMSFNTGVSDSSFRF
jgi:hypothetical protein